MLKVQNIIVFLAFFILVNSAFAANNYPQSMDELIALGLESNLGLQIDRLNVPSSGNAVTIEAAAFDSTFFAATSYDKKVSISDTHLSVQKTKNISAETGFSKQFKNGLISSVSLNSKIIDTNDSGKAINPNYRTALVLDITQPLLRNLGTSINTTRLLMAKNDQRQVVLKHLLNAQNLILQLEILTFELATKTKIVSLKHSALNLANELYNANRKRFTAGVIPVSEVQEAEAVTASRQLSLSLAIQEQQVVQQQLIRYFNRQLASDFVPDKMIDFDDFLEISNIPTISDLREVAFKNRLELKISGFKQKNLTLNNNYLHNQLKPSLDLNLQVGINGLSGNRTATATTNNYTGDWYDSISSMSNSDGYHWQAGIKFSMPIGNRIAKSRYQQGELQLKQEQYHHQDLRVAIESELLQQQINIASTHKQLKLAMQFEDLAETSFQQEQQRLNEGLSDTFRMVFFQQKMIAAKIDRIIAITRYHLALAQMDFATGNIFARHHIVLTDNTEELSLENI